MNVVYKSRDGLNDLIPLPVTQAVTWFSRSVYGGPKEAEIQVRGDELALWEFIEYLRRPVEIFSDKGDPLWWGFVSDVTLQLKQVEAAVNIGDMYNRVAVAYSYVEPGTNQVGERRTTDWVQNDDSVTEYGIKEMLLTISGSTAAHAEAARDMALATMAYPQPKITMTETNADIVATIHARGWYSTLEWQYYSAASGTADTAAQAVAIAQGEGQFFVAVNQDVTSGILTSQFRDGDGLASFEIDELMRMGTQNNRRMIADVDRTRTLTISEETAYSSTNPDNLLMNRNGEITTRFGDPVRAEACPVGRWVRLHDVIPGSVDITKLADPTLAFIDELEYNPATGRITILPRNVERPWDLGRPADG